MDFLDILILAVVAVWIFLAVRSAWRARKKGGCGCGSCGCSGCTGHCSGCSNARG